MSYSNSSIQNYSKYVAYIKENLNDHIEILIHSPIIMVGGELWK